MRIRGKRATKVKQMWKDHRMANRIKRILVYQLEKAPWIGLKERDAIDMWLKYKEAFLPKNATWAEKKALILEMFNDGDPILTQRAIRKPRISRSEPSIDYKKYLRSKEWQDVRERLFKARGRACEHCGSGDDINVHHKHYGSLYREKLKDLEVLCKPCHRKVHKLVKG